MAKKLVKHGNSLALLIEKPILKLMGIDEHTELEMSLEGKTLVIQSAQPKNRLKNQKTRKEEIKEIAKQIFEQYDPVFRKLAKT